MLFRIGGVVPIHRTRDGTDTRQNLSAFASCHAALARGAHIAIFPEGEMHTEPALMPLKTGAARIALGAATEAGVHGIVIVPVGLVYQDRGRFRSDIEIHFGDPIEIDEWAEQARSDPRKAAREVTDLLTDRLAQVTVNHGSHAEAALLNRAAELATIDLSETATRSYARRNGLRRSLAAAVCPAVGNPSTGYRALATAIDAHDADVEKLGISESRHALVLSEPSQEERTRLTVELALLATPAALGIITNAPVLLGAALANTKATHESWKATTQGIAGTLLCPIVWTLEYAYLARRIGRTRAALLVLTGAASGNTALAWQDRFQRRHAITRLDRAQRDRPTALAAARASRELVRQRVAVLSGRT
jgi:glycerol-3-phosphate O-acyltransferase/dihydroxyacetone phosphate acyltransferase